MLVMFDSYPLQPRRCLDNRFVYCIKDLNNNTRYVGKSGNGKESAMRHFRKTVFLKSSAPVHQWIKSCVESEGYYPSIFIIDYVEAGSDLDEREKFWINDFKASGCDLLNVQSGGINSGGYKLTPEHRAKISKSLIGNKRLVMTDEMRKKMSISNIGKHSAPKGPFSSEHRKKMSLARKGKPSPLRGTKFSAEAKERMRQGQIKRYSKQTEAIYS